MNVLYNLDNIEIEHIYPQNAANKNPALESEKNKIGNLTFWGPYDNKIASNNSFSVKREHYKNSNINITRRLDQSNSWDNDAIEDRKNMLIDIAKKVYTINLTTVNV